MSRFWTMSFMIGALVLLPCPPLHAKRVRPKPVPPVVSNGVQYSAEGDGRDEFVVAMDTASGTVLWTVKVEHNRLKPWIEEDNQWVFIDSLKLAGNLLLVRDEKSRCFSVDLTTKRASKRRCDADSVNGLR